MKVFSLFIIFVSLASSLLANVITPNDLLMARQSCGETQSTLPQGTSIRISGKQYTDLSAQHIMTYATSMIPVSIPDNAKKIRGACGIDDAAEGGSSITFSLLSGSEVLWSSGVMKKGMDAKEFNIPLPSGARKLYLLAHDEKGSNSGLADWVDLKWVTDSTERKKARSSKKIIKASDFGLQPGSRKDQTPALRKAITAAHANPGCTLDIPQGTYHFYREGSLPMSFHISNHDQPGIHPVCIPLIDLDNIKIKGNGSLFLFHGMLLPMVIMDSRNVTVEGLSIDYERPYYSEAVITALSDDGTEVTIDKKAFPYEIKENKLNFLGEGWGSGVSSAIIFQKGTGHILEGTADYGGTPHVTALPGGKIKLNWKLKEKNARPGDIITLRNWQRPHPAICIYRAENTVLDDVVMHSSMGMTLLAQRSSNIRVTGGGSFPRKETGRMYSASADATHFSNVKGLVLVEDGTYTGMMDDAINVHSTCLNITEIIGDSRIRVKYMHHQAVGFEVFLPGETLRFIAGPTLEEGEFSTVKSVEKLNTRELIIELTHLLPPGIKAGDAVENADYQPEVIFRRNIVSNNRARGSLFTTPHKVLVEDNLFDHSSGSAILLAGDAQGWYESGACHDVVIRSNKFINNLTSRYQFTNALISIYPEVKNLNDQTKYYHRNVIIEENEFQTFDVPLLFAISTDGIVFRKNKVIYNNDFKGWGQPPFHFRRCAHIEISENMVSPPIQWSLENVKLELTPENEIKFE